MFLGSGSLCCQPVILPQAVCTHCKISLFIFCLKRSLLKKMSRGRGHADLLVINPMRFLYMPQNGSSPSILPDWLPARSLDHKSINVKSEQEHGRRCQGDVVICSCVTLWSRETANTAACLQHRSKLGHSLIYLHRVVGYQANKVKGYAILPP